MNIQSAKQFVQRHARPVELAVYRYFFKHGSNREVLEALGAYQNPDGGFGHGLEPDCWNPLSSPIATNDALMTLFRTGALESDTEMRRGIVRYLESHDSFDEDKRRWLFAIDSNREYPHALWWEKTEDGIHGFNPTVSLAAFLVCYGTPDPLYGDILREGVRYLEETQEVSGEALKCFQLAYGLLRSRGVEELVDLSAFQTLLSRRIDGTICKESKKYGVEYVPMPSDFFAGGYAELMTPEMLPWIQCEQQAAAKLQMPDGGFDISWDWGRDPDAFAQARDWWRPRLTLERLLFDRLCTRVFASAPDIGMTE